MDVSSIAGGLGALKTATDMVKGAVKVANDLQHADLVQRLIEVQQALLDVQSQHLALTDDNYRMRREIEELRKSAEFKGKLIFDKQEQLYRISEAPEDDHSRFCPHCHDVGSVRRLVAKELYGGEIAIASLEVTEAWYCPQCQSYFRRRTPMPPFRQDEGGG